MPTYLNEQFYKNVKKEVKQYVNNYECMTERSEIIENQERERLIEEEESYAILEKFGAIL